MSEPQKSNGLIQKISFLTFYRKLQGKTLTVRQTLLLFLILIIVSNGFMMVLRGTGLRSTRKSVSESTSYSMGYGASPYFATPSSPRATSAPLPKKVTDQRSDQMAAAARKGGPNIAEELIQDATGGALAKAVQADRRIIYTATVDLVTENLSKVETLLLEMIKTAGGFVAETNQTGASGGHRSATWRVRVPVSEYDGFLQKARTLGELQSVMVNSQDVTEEFVDVTARISAKKIQEQRLIDLIKNATAKLEDVLKVESELARVRSEIERMEGRIRFLKDQTELTTVTINVREMKNYTPLEAPTFATKLRRTWEASTEALANNTGESILGLVAWVPFLPIYIAVIGLGLWIVWQIWRKIRPWLTAHISFSPKTKSLQPKPAATQPPTST